MKAAPSSCRESTKRMSSRPCMAVIMVLVVVPTMPNTWSTPSARRAAITASPAFIRGIGSSSRVVDAVDSAISWGCRLQRLGGAGPETLVPRLLAGGEGQGRGGGKQIRAALDVGGPGPSQIALGGQELDDRGQPRRPIRLEGGGVGLLGGGEQRDGELPLAQGRLHVRVGLPHLADGAQLERRQFGLGGPALGH